VILFGFENVTSNVAFCTHKLRTKTIASFLVANTVSYTKVFIIGELSISNIVNGISSFENFATSAVTFDSINFGYIGFRHFLFYFDITENTK
jgi:hypothetical protein